MRVDALHRKLVKDGLLLHAAVSSILSPEPLPVCKNLMNRLNRVTETLGVFNEIEWDKELKTGEVRTSGWWNPKTELPENGSSADIRIIWHLHPSHKNCRVMPTLAEWTRRRFYFWSIFFHELMHRYQNIGRGPDEARTYRPRSQDRDNKEDQVYYGNYDEIEAHAYDAALEFCTWWGHLGYQDALAECYSYHGRVVVPTYNLIDVVFAMSPGHPAMIQFKRKVRAWYKVIKQNPALYEVLALPNLVT